MSGWELFVVIYLALSIFAQVIFTIIVSVGGFFDLRYLFRKLNEDHKNQQGDEPETADGS